MKVKDVSKHTGAAQAGLPMSLSKFRRDVGVSAPTVWRWRKEGRLRTTNISGRLFVLPEHLQEFNTRAAAGEFARIIVTPKTAAA